MTPKERLYRDIEQICSKADALYGFYTRLHSYNDLGQPTELPEFIERARKLMGDRAAVYLYNAGIIRQQQGGEYDFSFPPTVADGGGMSYNRIGDEDGFDYRMTYFFDDRTANDRHNIYHELGHLMQYRLNMFNTREINRIYRFLSKGCNKKKMPKSEIARRFAKSSSYTNYLLESHANAFADACLLLRTENRGERIRQSISCYLRDADTFFEGLTDTDKEYPGMKYYASLPVQKAVIREVNRWFKNGELSRYKDSAGEIDFDAVALRMHDIVMEKAYSPQTFKQFLDMNFTAFHPKNEQGWRHFVPEAAAARIICLFDGKTRRDLQLLTDLHEDIDLTRRVPAFRPLPEKDQAAALLNLCCRLDNAIVALHNCAEVMEVDIPKYDELNLDCAIYYGGIPDSVIDTLTIKMTQNYDLRQDEIEMLLKPYQKEVNDLLNADYDENLLCNVMGAMNRPECREILWKMYYDRMKNPEAKICPEAIQLPLEKLSPKAMLKAEGRLFKDIRRIVMSEIGTGENGANINNLRLCIFNTAANDPDGLASSAFADKNFKLIPADRHGQILESLDKLHTLYFTDKNLFRQTMRKYHKVFLTLTKQTKNKPIGKPCGIER